MQNHIRHLVKLIQEMSCKQRMQPFSRRSNLEACVTVRLTREIILLFDIWSLKVP